MKILNNLIGFMLVMAFVLPSMAQYRLGEEKPVQIKKKKQRKSPENKKRDATRKKAFKSWPDNTKVSRENNLRSGTMTINKAPSVLTEEPSLKLLSQKYHIDIDKLEYLRSLRHGYREIVTGLIVSRDAQVELGRVLNMRVQNDKWNKIFNRFYLDPKIVNNEAAAVLGSIKKSISSKRIEERPKRHE